MKKLFKLAIVCFASALALPVVSQRVIDMEGYSDYSIRLDSNVVFYTIYCDRPNLKRLFVKRKFDGAEYIENVQLQGKVDFH